MNNDISLFDEQDIKSLIHELLTEKKRYKQEKTLPVRTVVKEGLRNTEVLK